ncbi:MAG TPA: ankyrin repeat domain-containing protein [Sphingomonas sp.]|nr:ankyrin repeat domain-containing protein [Sphingomonas sp.]
MRGFDAKGWLGLLLGAMLLGAAAPAAAQSFASDGYNFIKAVKDRDGAKAQALLEKPGSTVISARDDSTGETALHIATKRRDGTWMRYLMGKGADLNARDEQGRTPLADAALIGYTDGAQLLIDYGAAVDLADNRGETPLTLAVQGHDLATVRALVKAGADPKITDNVTGMSALDYARRDPRSKQILQILETAKPTVHRQIAGPSPQ